MKYFKDYTLSWWQFGLMKISLIALGILIGCTWPAVFGGAWVIALLWGAFAVPAIYLAAVSLKQVGK